MSKAKSLVEKLAEACDSVGGIEKKGKNVTQNYDYVKAADVAKAIRRQLFSRGVIIMANELEFSKTNEFETRNGAKMREFTLKVEYSILDSESDQKIVAHAFGVAMDTGDKAIYKCKTGALKYFLRGLGLIPDEKDDPEADESVDRETVADKKLAKLEKKMEGQKKILPYQVKAFEDACKEAGHGKAQIAEFLNDMDYPSVEDIQVIDWNVCIKWANRPTPIPDDLTKRTARSVERINGLRQEASGD